MIALDLIGVFVFSATGALLAMRAELDVFGVAVIAFVSGLGGGVIRDVLLGSVPPAAVTDWRYVVVGVGGGLAVFLFPHFVARMARPFLILDALGLGLFSVAGTTKALDVELGTVGALIMGILTAVGGGIIRDILVTRVPDLFRGEIYAFAAAVGSAGAIGGHELGLHKELTVPIAVLLAALTRLLAVKLGWKAPISRTKAT